MGEKPILDIAARILDISRPTSILDIMTPILDKHLAHTLTTPAQARGKRNSFAEYHKHLLTEPN